MTGELSLQHAVRKTPQDTMRLAPRRPATAAGLQSLDGWIRTKNAQVASTWASELPMRARYANPSDGEQVVLTAG